jgi:hypothetical protein
MVALDQHHSVDRRRAMEDFSHQHQRMRNANAVSGSSKLISSRLMKNL